MKTVIAYAVAGIIVFGSGYAAGKFVADANHTEEMNQLLIKHNKALQVEADKANEERKNHNRVSQELDELNARYSKDMQEKDNETTKLKSDIIAGTKRVQFLSRELTNAERANQSTAACTVGISEIELPKSVQLDISDLHQSIEDDDRKINYWINYSRMLWLKLYNEKAPF